MPRRTTPKGPFTGRLLLALALAATIAWSAPADAQGEALSTEQLVDLLKVVDDRQRNSGDYKSLAYIEQREKDKELMVYEAVVYRRDADDRFMILFTRPKAEAGKGYLRIDKNLFIYDPTVGKWERRTERERIGGTDSRRTDFDESRLAEEYDPSYVGRETLGKFTVHHLKLTAKKDVDVAYPVLELWIDADSQNILKAQDRALSGKLMRTVYYPQWVKVFSESKGAEVYVPKEIHIYDEVEKGNQTHVVIRSVDLKSLPANIFTKAWLESQSR
ncbi:MAG: outer membrane lipoprotein-sorting protein [Myxococcales bacterium]|nr:outer membrane lipoprotein-sorting protein [Myxococcales bacterium]